ncbi:MAG: DNA mismatch repair endonuclease MutL [Desulfobacterota bacterium]|nr:DNA mismatch repair endonuclease MutL [Thermodesulfobacteriota bacterium]
MGTAKIRILPDPVAQKIAAGEVVERPASVVKELIENAIDAGASEIVVELQGGGLQRIRVCDDGEGMVPEDVPLALQRFATSKIQNAEDLSSIQTLGFRGEALPSIASVSKMIIRSRPPGLLYGTQAISEGGELQGLSEVGCPVGTEVEVLDLFYNLPARRKFLRSIRTELRYILNQFHRIGLAFPSITFKLIHEGRLLEELIRTDSLLVRAEAVLGREVIDHLCPFDYEEGGVEVRGLTSLPPFSKVNREGFFTYVQRRWVRDRILNRAILNAYQTYLPSDRYPVTILMLDLPPSWVDVNVHPAKAEVRFRDPERIYQTVWASLRGLLEERSLGKSSVGKPKLKEEEASPPSSSHPLPLGDPQGERGLYENIRVGEPHSSWERRGSFRVVGQLWGTYILIETDRRLIFVDQHAAHERILYERLKRETEEEGLAPEPLLLPLLIEVSLEESLLIDSFQDELKAGGFEIEAVGERLYAVRSIPSLLQIERAEETLRLVLKDLAAFQRGGTPDLQAFLTSLACHASVRANYSLNPQEIEKLLEPLYPFPPSLTCPHGRPIFYVVTLEEMNRQFKRE